MPIRIPDALPAAAQLESENIFVMTEYRALHQDIRPLRVLILNLMPTKIATETQIMRKLSNTPLQVEVDLLRTKTHEATARERRPPGDVLPHVRRHPRHPLRRPDHHRRAGGADAVRGGRLLARALPDHGLDPPRMCTLRCTFVGARRPGCTIITVFRSTTCRQRRAACSSIIW